MFKLTVEVSDTLMDELIFALHHADGHSLPELYMLYTKMVKLKNEYLRDKITKPVVGPAFTVEFK